MDGGANAKQSGAAAMRMAATDFMVLVSLMKMGVRWSDEKKNLSGDLDQHPRGVFFVLYVTFDLEGQLGH